ncbi:substrate-binding domain-containing protein [Arthrobacter sp. CC3]|uniref:sugar ABC transporter substrate-binding protein n=1 Tax=Arthrobacter sp. CC3 TaxID=3029185 RepID=UPI003264EF05
MFKSKNPMRRGTGGLITVAVTIALAGCSGGATASSLATGSGSTPSVQAIRTLAQLHKGTETAPPAKGPAAVAGKKVWFVSCGQSIPDCSVPAAAAKEAAGTLGWDFKIADGALNVGGANASAFRTALASNPDAIIVHGISCEAIRQPLLEAKAQGVPVMGLESLDCDGQPLFTAEMKYGDEFPTVKDYLYSWGVWGASYLAAGGQAPRIIVEKSDEPLLAAIGKGFTDTLASCSTCKVITDISFISSDLVTNGPLSQRLRASLAKNPDLTAVFMPVDVNMAGADGAQDVKRAGLPQQITIAGGTGSPTTLDMIRSGAVAEVTAHDIGWLAYGAMDNLNRTFAGQSAVSQGIGVVAVDKTANLPAVPGSNYTSQVGWKAAYTALWSGK